MSDGAALQLYGHRFSSYTWKAQIALDAAGFVPEFRILDPEHPEHGAFVHAHGGPWDRFPVLVDGDEVIFEATVIIEYIAARYPSSARLIPPAAVEAVRVRMIDRVFDNYVMEPMQVVVNEYLRDADAPDQVRVVDARARLRRSYAWLEDWLADYRQPAEHVTLIECAAAPSLFYADWVEPIDATWPRLAAWRAQLLAMPQVSRCVEAARPYRAGFPLGAPDRD